MAEAESMTPTQFDALSKLIRLRTGPAAEGARLVLVSGATMTHAAVQAGCSRQSVSNTVDRVRKGYALAVLAAGAL